MRSKERVVSTIQEAMDRWVGAREFAEKRIADVTADLNAALMLGAIGAPVAVATEAAFNRATAAIKAAGDAARALREAEGGT
jgi:hypothetical protein